MSSGVLALVQARCFIAGLVQSCPFDLQRAGVEEGALQSSKSSISLGVGAHLDERNAARSTGLVIDKKCTTVDGAMLLKEVRELLFGSRERNVADV